jgi:peptidyl-dipeptidase A
VAVATLCHGGATPTPLIDYFAPLHRWLKEQNKGETCGW